MMHIETGTYYEPNKVASFIWTQISEPKRVADITSAIQSEFEVDQVRCQEDALNFLKGMIEDGVVQVVEADAG